ncbi:two component transcriptional regulator, LytTR family [Filimonas lacunae]|uniref:Two component transcriptional regulator, LytTR family n=1 Tax=Filimonas lacunae TaxID=477680 RepID=A0A173MDG8_9BACT|nr:LytTR family DNA-binding domain-containing protein [Filimonas lacunae]BAV05491.1 two-component system response regulator [Filimonas lacunae]SIT20754.1 two component transcriptional regulator, LytTR family [Filimonas lacunae]
MNIVIIEDERLVAEDLEESITSIVQEPTVITQLHSVKEAVKYFKSHPAPDLIFSDIQLGDGLSFDIFEQVPVTAPVIFCTAFDEYAITAFRTNSIDYILKPYSVAAIEAALLKYQQFKEVFTPPQAASYKELIHLLHTQQASTANTSVLVHFQDKIIPVKTEDIALFYLEKEVIHLRTFNGKIYFPNKNLEELEKATGFQFFRANRQVLISRKAIIDASSFFSRKLSLNLTIEFPERITVSKNRIPAFLEWLSKS